MAEYTIKQKNKLLKKLKALNITSEKDIMNIRVSDLKKLNVVENIEKWTIKDIEVLWSMQEAIENKSLLDFFVDIQ